MKEVSGRFYSHVDIKGEDDCWSWLGCFHNGDKLGYGTFKYKGKVIYSHRAAYEIANGHIPEGLLILHKCDHKWCCNPKHLYAGTNGDNVCDAVQRGTVSHNLGRLGYAGGKFLHEGEIWLVRRLRILKSGRAKKCYKFPASYVAKMFKTSSSTIHKIWNSEKVWCAEEKYV